MGRKILQKYKKKTRLAARRGKVERASSGFPSAPAGREPGPVSPQPCLAAAARLQAASHPSVQPPRRSVRFPIPHLSFSGLPGGLVGGKTANGSGRSRLSPGQCPAAAPARPASRAVQSEAPLPPRRVLGRCPRGVTCGILPRRLTLNRPATRSFCLETSDQG